MDFRRRRGRQTVETFIDEATTALGATTGSGPEPILLGYYPRFQTNPYQQLLYRRAPDHGLAPVGIRRLDVLPGVTELRRRGVRTVLHLHWLHLVLRDAASEADGARRVAGFLAELDRHRAAGGRLAWTVHNILPHETRWERLEVELCAGVAARADVIHVLAAATRELVAPYYELPPERILHVPHPSYAGAYDDAVSRVDARRDLGLQADDFAYLVLGAIRPYKGLGRLLTAWDSLPPDPTRRLVVAGEAIEGTGVEPLLEALARAPGVILDAHKVPAERVPVYLRAADVGVLPHTRALNSGALMLYLTFGLPVIVPAGGGLEGVVEPSFATAFEPGTPDGLARALGVARSTVTPEARAAALAVARSLPPDELSSRFAQELRARLEAPA